MAVSSPQAEVPHERRILTALCYDLVGSTDLLTALDMEDVQDLMSAFQHAVRQAIVSNSGVVTVEAGDGGVALFPTEIDARDSAALAVGAGLDIVEACRRVGRESGRPDLQVRVGIATSVSLIQGGPEQAIPDHVTGPALAMATRLQGIADPNTVLTSHKTRSLARRSHAFVFRGARTVKGFVEPERVWRALRHKRQVDRFFAFGRLTSPLVGRAEELSVISDLWANAVSGQGEALFIEGEPGVGKSRLVHEVRRTTRRERAQLLLFQCSPGGDRSVLLPLLQALSEGVGQATGPPTSAAIAEQLRRLGITDAGVADLFSFLLGAKGASPALQDADLETIRERTHWAIRRSLEALCASGPIVVAVEDVHWIDPTSWQLLAEVVRIVPQYPALLIVTARRGSSARRSEAHGFRHIGLSPLDQQEARKAITNLWPSGRDTDQTELLDTIGRITGGIPLYIEETCQWLAEAAGPAADKLARTISQSHGSTFESVVEARLGSLGLAKDISQAAAVAGNRFDQALLVVLLPELEQETIGDALEALSDAGFLRRIRPSGRPAYEFRHALIQETIYNSLLRKRRQGLQRTLFNAVDRDRRIAPWIGTAELAVLAERAGLPENAIELLIVAGKDGFSRSALVEARQLLDHALALCDSLSEPQPREILRLSAMVALGPVLTSAEGPNSPPAQKLYQDGVDLARRRPLAERAKWFPLYWGWWFTGTDVDGERARAVLDELRDVEDSEVQLQTRHCVWTIDFYLARHESCISAVDAGLSLYDSVDRGEDTTLFGGHDARVCGLAHRSLSLWFTGRAASATRSAEEARSWAHQLGHAGSIAHACVNQAMLHYFRRDISALRNVVGEIRSITGSYIFPSLVATTQILEGWCDGVSGDPGKGIALMRQGLAAHHERQTPEDYPVYCGMLAETLALDGETCEGLELISLATSEVERSGQRYWLADLHRRKAYLLFQKGAPPDEIVSALSMSLAVAAEQNAVPLLLTTYDALLWSGLSPELGLLYRECADAAKTRLNPNAALIVNPEPMPRHGRAK
ncbi:MULTISPECIES: ATP-binding protein [unclassified Inquilinus]|uniref:ATP-binding protein n=1 Tax=unclassified Inquilinus TaxID=2645927 RepID=UPI003F922F94